MSTSKSKSKSVRGSLAKSYQLLTSNKDKKKNASTSSQPAAVVAGMKNKIDEACEPDLEKGEAAAAPKDVLPTSPQQSSPISINSDPATGQGQQQAPKIPDETLSKSESQDSALGASTVTQTTIGTIGTIGPVGARRESFGVDMSQARELGEKEKTELAEALVDPKQLWEGYFSGIIDDFADAIEENVEEVEAAPTHSREVLEAQKRGEHRFAGVCHFPLKLIFTPLKQGRRIANTFASILEMQFGPLHAALQVGSVILEWDDSSIVTPYQCDYEDQVLQVDVQAYSEWTKYTSRHHTKIKKALEGLNYGQQIELIYTVSSEKKRLIDALIAVIVKYNKFYYYNLFDRNCQHFVCDALTALEVKLPREFMGGLGDYYKALIKGKTPFVPSEFDTHSDLDLYVMQKKEGGILTSMPQHDLEYLLALYFRFHLESKTKLKGNQKALDEWRCTEELCQAKVVEGHIELQSMAIHNFKTIS